MLNTVTKMTSSINIDEFGRDISLRNEIAANLFITQLRNKFANKSWAEICYEEEEEEERQREEEERQREEEERQREEERAKELKEQTEMRKALLSEGKYELEEGEILE